MTGGSAVLTDAGRARSNAAAIAAYYMAGTPPSADYEVEKDVYIASLASGGFALLARANTGVATYYLFNYDRATNTVNLLTVVNGSVVGSTASASFTPEVGVTYNFKLKVAGSTVSGYIDGIKYVQKTDANIAGAGKAGVSVTNQIYTNTTGYHFDNFKAADYSQLTEAFSRNITPADLFNNGYDNVAIPRQSEFSFVRVVTDAQVVRIKGTTTVLSESPNGYPAFGVVVDGAYYRTVKFSANGQETFDVPLPRGTKTVDIVTGPSNRITTDVLGSFLDTISFLGASFANYATPSIGGSRMVVYADSIPSGFGESRYLAMKAWPNLLRYGGRDIMMEGFNGRSLKDDAVDAPARAAFVARIVGYQPARLWIEVGVNDYATNTGLWSAANFGAAYAALLDAFHISLPSLQIFAQTPIVRTSEGANSFSNTLGDYRAAIASAASGKAWVTVVDGTALMSSGGLSGDGTHPSTAGQATLAASIASLL